MAASIDSADLRLLLEKLPQELYDMIYKDVFTATPCSRNPTTGQGVNNNMLQVSRHTRAEYAKTYYGPGAEFVFNHRDDPFSYVAMISWIETLPAEHVNLIDHILFILEKETEEDGTRMDVDVDTSIEVQKLELAVKFIPDHVVDKCDYRFVVVIDPDESRLSIMEALESRAYIFGARRSKRWLRRIWAATQPASHLRKLQRPS
ncbi:uncharacterized protein RCC_01315 [Ramularia collo-cygni]|uniref:Uncharacterized protein n=1 Tax=Ramularia collo-cygni TaxID=112498 RepID=A0A2D3V1S7_9PEZI|nr:uncharacterized protein RCC_01315 [Ramularia collo-cygni]CZT15459.1 uncharacterized protein RCC_01315 [Ramularia collo-cygni]